MSMPKDEIHQEMVEACRAYLDGLEKALSDALFSISEPRWANDEDSRRIKALKRRVYDMYANYRDVYPQGA